MPRLRSEPAGVVESLDELFALAHAMESEAAARYSEFALAMREQGHEELAAVFESIADEERGHVARVDAWSEQRSGHKPFPDALHFRPPPTFEEEDATEMGGSRLLTPYRVLTIATRNEERAFSFWSYVAAHAKSADIRHAAETMAKEELGHVAAFRRERRKAFHAGRRRTVATPQPVSDLELRLAALLERLAADDPGSGNLPGLTEKSRAMAVEARRLDLTVVSASDAAAEGVAEALVDAYLNGAEACTDPAEIELCQQLAQSAIRRLAALRDRA